MDPITILRGKQIFLVVQQGPNEITKGLATPFIGYIEINSRPHLGFGIYIEKGPCLFYSGGAIELENLIQAWRSVKIIEKLTGVTSNTMSDIWDTAGRGVVQMMPSIELVSQLYRDPTNFSSVVEEIFKSAPETADLDYMIKNCLKNNVPVNLHEIAYEIALGTITESEYFSELRKEKKIPIPVIEEKRKPIFDDEDFDAKLHEFHEIAIILEKEIVNPETD